VMEIGLRHWTRVTMGELLRSKVKVTEDENVEIVFRKYLRKSGSLTSNQNRNDPMAHFTHVLYVNTFHRRKSALRYLPVFEKKTFFANSSKMECHCSVLLGTLIVLEVYSWCDCQKLRVVAEIQVKSSQVAFNAM